MGTQGTPTCLPGCTFPQPAPAGASAIGSRVQVLGLVDFVIAIAVLIDIAVSVVVIVSTIAIIIDFYPQYVY